jgi:hypothetical protein
MYEVCEMHAHQMHAHKMYACEMHAHKMHAREMHVPIRIPYKTRATRPTCEFADSRIRIRNCSPETFRSDTIVVRPSLLHFVDRERSPASKDLCL